MRRYNGTFDVLFEEMEKQFNKETKEGWRFAADAARITDERASSEDRTHTSGGVFVAIDSNIGPVAFSGCLGLRNGMSQGDTGRMASFSSSSLWKESQWSSGS